MGFLFLRILIEEMAMKQLVLKSAVRCKNFCFHPTVLLRSDIKEKKWWNGLIKLKISYFKILWWAVVIRSMWKREKEGEKDRWREEGRISCGIKKYKFRLVSDIHKFETTHIHLSFYGLNITVLLVTYTCTAL